MSIIDVSQNPGQQFTLAMPMLSEIYLLHLKMEWVTAALATNENKNKCIKVQKGPRKAKNNFFMILMMKATTC